jgi:branched-chain amino acid transport system substrate-binding protein
MSEADSRQGSEQEQGFLAGRRLSRRDFLKVSGAAAAGAGLSGGFAALLGGCSGNGQTTSTTGSATTATTVTSTTTGATSSTAEQASTTTLTASAEEGAEFKAGYILPITGSMADLGAVATWQIDWFGKNLWKDGLLMGDGKKHKVTVVLKDMQSDSNRASQAAQDLISTEKVMLVGASAGAANVLPVREVAEDFGCPCITCDCSGDAWNVDQPEGGFKWSWHTWFVLRDMATNFVAMWDSLKTNKVVGGLYPNDGDGNAFADALPLVFQAKGYSYVDPGRFEDGTEDYTAVIAEMRKQGVEIVNGVPTPQDYASFWKQAVQQGFHPKASTQARAMLFPAGVNALGDLGDGQTVECWFHPAFPYKSSVTGLTPQQVCDLWEEDKTEQWTQPICYFGQFEVWTDILTRCKDPFDKNEIVNATKQTKITTIGGPVDWTVNPEPYSGFYNFSTKPIAAGQWVKGAGAWQYDMEIVASATQPDIQTTAAVKELSYPS